MWLYGLLATGCFADFKLSMQLCSDADTDDGVVPEATGKRSG